MLRICSLLNLLFALSLSGVNGSVIETSTCDASCLDGATRKWPPTGFVLSEREVRCSLRCKSERDNRCFRECLAQLNASCPNSQGYCKTGNNAQMIQNENESNLLAQATVEKNRSNHFQVTIPEFNSDNVSTFYYLVLENQFTNQSAFKEMSTSTMTIDLSGLICSDLKIFYTIDSWLMRPTLISIPTEISIRSAVPSNLMVKFEEDFSLVRHAILNVSWAAMDPTRLCYYRVTLQPLTNTTDDTCNNQSSFLVILNKFQSSLTIDASSINNGSAPVYDCMYNVVVQTFPGGGSITQSVDIKYDGPQSNFTLQCYAIYNDTSQDYDIIGKWSVSDQRAVEVIPKYSVLLKRFFTRGDVFPDDIPGIFPTKTNASSVIYKNQMILKGTGYYELSVWSFLPEPGSPYDYRISLHPGTKKEFCVVEAPLRQPDTITMVSIHEPFFSTNFIKFTINWILPDFFNGELKETEMRVLGHVKSASINATIKTRTIEPTRTSAVQTIPGLTAENTTFSTLYVQMRVRDEEDLHSDWSSAAFLTLAEVPIVTDAIRLSTSRPTVSARDVVTLGTLPAYGSALIALAVVLAIIAGIMGTLIVMHFILSNRRRRKLMERSDSDVIILPRTGSFKRWPALLKPLQSTFSLDAWEVALEDITIFENSVLGRGHFGEVNKGQLSGRGYKRGSIRGIRVPRFSLNCIVAIKRLQNHVDQFEKSNFLKEIEMMKKVSGNDNDLSKFVVNMIGCVTTKEPMLLILEYMKYGNLLSYLRYLRDKKVNKESHAPAPYLEPSGTYSKLPPSDSQYDGLGDIEEKDLLEFARQIAAGMEFLSGLGIIHRDLACRNILLGESKNLKISDFGLSRHLSPDDIYVPTSHGVLPIRWMSLESLFHREFTSASDVWSYGVVLWEIATLGATPYFKYSNEEVTRLLRQGYRMKKPENCSIDVYDKMLYCWSEMPDERPKFSELRKEFDCFLSAHIQDRYPYIEIEATQSYHFDKLAPETGQRRGSSSSEEMKTVNLSDEDEDDMLALQMKQSLAPQKTTSKMSILSSSTFCFDDDEEKVDLSVILRGENADSAPQIILSPISSTANTYDTLSQAITSTADGYDTQSPVASNFTTVTNTSLTLTSSDVEPKVIKPSCDRNKEDDRELEKSSTSRSSFRDELLYHFERRLSDLGPRKNYPYLQNLERSVTSGAYDALEKKENEDSHEKKSRRVHNAPKRKRVIRDGGRRWARCGGYFDASDVLDGTKYIEQNGSTHEGEDHGCHTWQRNNESSERNISVFEASLKGNNSQGNQYDTLEPNNYDVLEVNTYDTLEPYSYDSLETC